MISNSHKLQNIDYGSQGNVGIRRERVMILLFASSLFSASVITVTVAGFQLSVFRATLAWASLFLLSPNIAKMDNKYCVAMFIWLMYGVLSVIWCKYTSLWAHQMYFLFSGFACVFLLSKYLVSFKGFLKACSVYSIFLAAHNAIGYYEMLTRDYHWVADAALAGYTNAVKFPLALPVSVFSNPNNYATVLLFGIAILAICLHYTKTQVGKLAYTCILVYSVYQLVRTRSRANLLALVIGMIVFILLMRKISSKKLAVYSILILLAGLVLLLSPQMASIESFAESYLQFDFENKSESVRLNLIGAGWQSFVQTCGIGTGAGNLSYWIGHYYGTPTANLHFWWLEVLFTYGIGIFVIYMSQYIKLTINAMRSARNGSYISRVFAAFLVAYVMGAISSSSNMRNETIWCAWAFIIAAQLNIVDQEEPQSV